MIQSGQPKLLVNTTTNIILSQILLTTNLYFFFSVRSVMHKYLEKKNEVNFDKIFNQTLGKLIDNILCKLSYCSRI